MANVRSGNSFYIDTQYSAGSDELTVSNARITYVVVTATAGSGKIVLGDSTTTKADLRVVTSGASQVFDFSRKPLVFSQSIRPITLSNAVAMVVFELIGS